VHLLLTHRPVRLGSLIALLIVWLAPQLVAAQGDAGEVAASRPATGSRTFTFRYQVEIGPVESGLGPVHVFVPLAAQTAQQRVLAERVDASIPGAIETEPAYGNRTWHGMLEVSDEHPIRVAVVTTVERVASGGGVGSGTETLALASPDELELFLGSNSRVVVGHAILEPILEEVRQKADPRDKAGVSRAIYDWVVDNVEYKKVGKGWGNGDTFWACSERYGNCTDFHALFISLARTEGIPARFEIGFPVPEDRAVGQIAGYHCWVEFYLPGVGWIPIDASEAFKHPEKRDFFYGTHPTDRIHLTTGRGLRLGDDHQDAPLNYFVYPYVEVAGRRWAGAIAKSFSYTAPESERAAR
jgi:hypothetical protein